MKNESLCKILAHNLCCLIMSQCELGIEPIFWEGQKAKEIQPVEVKEVVELVPVAVGKMVEVVEVSAPVARAYAGCAGA
jgi:hypothetical protein